LTSKKESIRTENDNDLQLTNNEKSDSLSVDMNSNFDSNDLKKKLERFTQITSKIHEFLWSVIFDDGNEDVFYTESIKNLTGYSAEEIKKLPGRGLSIVFDEDIECVKQKLCDFENDPSLYSLELIYRIVKKSSDIIWIKEGINVERDINGKITRYDGIVSDINDIKKAEEALKKSEESFKEKNIAKDRFISIISHDLRAPFTSILGFAEILLNEKDLPDIEKEEYLTYIYESSQHQLQLVNYLLDYSRLQTGRIKLEPQRIKASTLVYNCVSSLTGNSMRKNINIKSTVPDEIYIQADERLITQALSNLLSNAIKFTEENKCIDVSARRFKEGVIEFVVKDEGVGISEANKSKIFHFDQKFTCEGTKGEKGTGLGLTLVKEIIEKHTGEIWFYSELNKGSEFHFTVPEIKNLVVLVEDNRELNSLLKNNIRKNFPDYEIFEAGNGFEAMEIIHKYIPAILITDHEMALMDGIQLIEALRKKDEKNRIPAIVIAQEIQDEIKYRYNKLGVDSVLIKPIDLNIFEETLLSLVR
jgi:PAS domain S-box-containing protein